MAEICFGQFDLPVEIRRKMAKKACLADFGRMQGLGSGLGQFVPTVGLLPFFNHQISDKTNDRADHPQHEEDGDDDSKGEPAGKAARIPRQVLTAKRAGKSNIVKK